MHTTTLLAICAPTLASANLIQWPSEFDLQKIIQQNNRVFVSFTSPRLESISSLNQVFDESATELSTAFITIDCDIGISLCKKYDVNSFPTLRLLERTKQGEEMKTTRYRGPRRIQDIQSFIKKRELPFLSEIKDLESDIRHIDSIVFVAYLASSNKDLLETYTAIAQKHHHDFVFGYTTSPTFTTDIGKTSAPSIICYRNLDADTLVLRAPFTFSDVENFIATAKNSHIKSFRERDIETFMQPSKLTVYIFTSPSLPSDTSLRHTLTPLAQTYSQFVIFAIVDLSRYPDMPANFGIKEMQGDTALSVHAPGNDQIFKYAQGKKIERGVVEDMLVTILQGRAVDGQVFGEGAGNEDDGGEGEIEGGHDEL